jgi:hypothetical protein
MSDDPRAGPPDLRAHPPRRWNVALEGVIWLPRMIDKARAYDAGTLGLYLYGQSPIDALVLRIARIGYSQFLAAVRNAADDRAVLEAVERQAPGATGRLQRFSRRPPLAVRIWVRALDFDDGYVSAPGSSRWRAVSPAIFRPLTTFLRRAFPLKPEAEAGG